MKLSFTRQSSYLAAGCLAGFLAATAFSPLLEVLAARNPLTSNDDLSEVQTYIGECRQVIPVNGSVEVYDNTDLDKNPATRIGTIRVGTTMRLTGVLRETDDDTIPNVAQVFLPGSSFMPTRPVGWVDASKITSWPCN